MTAEIISLPYSVTRKLHARKPRKSKNGTPEERAAKARKVDAEPTAAVEHAASAAVLAFRRPEETAPPPSIAVDESAPAPHVFSPRTLYSDAFFRLPFVTPPDSDVSGWAEFWQRTDMWNDAASAATYQTGRQYAKAGIAAIRRDDSCTRQLEIVVEKMLEKAFRRRDAKGNASRGLSPSEKGFLAELANAAIRDEEPKAP